jgi:hypothetical protein
MNTQRHSSILSLIGIGLLALSILSACGAANAEPTIAPEAIFTSAYETFSAQMATEQAAVTPTYTPPPLPSPSPFPTLAAIFTQPSFSFSGPTPGAVGGTDGCENRSTWIADVTIPDNTTFTPGQDFKKTWRVQNTGTCTWNSKYTLKFKDGTKMAGTDQLVPISVPPGQQAEVSVNLEAPKDIGSFYGRWVLNDPDGKPFGSFLTVVIKVEGTAP